MSENTTIAVLGLGEAGGAIAADLVAAGATVHGYDPAVAAGDGVIGAGSEAEAVANAGLVLSVNSSAAAMDALRAGVAAAATDTVWADLNTASPEKKRRLEEMAAQHDVAFADFAIMAPVPGKGLRVPMLASGAAAAPAAEVLRGWGASVEVMAQPAGTAASRKLLRSVFFKGMSSAIVEALDAARAAGCEDWLRGVIVDELTKAGEPTVERMVSGMRIHAVRREAEMAAAAAMLTELDVPSDIAAASRRQLERLAEPTD